MSKFRVLEKRILTQDCFVIRMERNSLRVQAGQHVNIGISKGGVNREYSLYCSEQDPYLEFLIRKIEGGLVSPALLSLNAGDYAEIDGPFGEFTISRTNLNRSFTFIATGTGIAPFKCFVSSYPGLEYRLIHGVRKKEEQYEKSFYESRRYTACVSGEDGGDFKGRVTDYLNAHPEEILLNRLYYLCGNRKMISDVFDILTDSGVNGNNIKTEVFF